MSEKEFKVSSVLKIGLVSIISSFLIFSMAIVFVADIIKDYVNSNLDNNLIVYWIMSLFFLVGIVLTIIVSFISYKEVQRKYVALASILGLFANLVFWIVVSQFYIYFYAPEIDFGDMINRLILSIKVMFSFAIFAFDNPMWFFLLVQITYSVFFMIYLIQYHPRVSKVREIFTKNSQILDAKNLMTRKKKEFKLIYDAFKILFSSILFVAVYKSWISLMPYDYTQFFSLWISQIVIGIIVGFLAYPLYRMFGDLEYRELNSGRRSEYYLSVLISTLIYTILLFFFIYVDIVSKATDIWSLIVIILLIRTFIYLLSYTVSSKFLGGRKVG